MGKAMKTRKSWAEKLADDKGLPRVQRVTGGLSRRWGTGTMVIPAPREVDALMKQVPRGRVTTIHELCAALASRHHADFACPLTTGIFAWIAAHAAAEAAAAGRKRVTPYWRTLKAGGELNSKYPGGIETVRPLLETEGHRLETRGKRCFVAGFRERLFSRFV
jgi:alkylated DNA nucleotide flippase Atl1